MKAIVNKTLITVSILIFPFITIAQNFDLGFGLNSHQFFGERLMSPELQPNLTEPFNSQVESISSIAKVDFGGYIPVVQNIAKKIAFGISPTLNLGFGIGNQTNGTMNAGNYYHGVQSQCYFNMRIGQGSTTSRMYGKRKKGKLGAGVGIGGQFTGAQTDFYGSGGTSLAYITPSAIAELYWLTEEFGLLRFRFYTNLTKHNISNEGYSKMSLHEYGISISKIFLNTFSKRGKMNITKKKNISTWF